MSIKSALITSYYNDKKILIKIFIFVNIPIFEMKTAQALLTRKDLK